MIFFKDAWCEIHQGNVTEVLAGLPAGSVHMVATSPPYWGLRDYQTGEWQGGDPACDHKPGSTTRAAGSTLSGGHNHGGHLLEGYKDSCPKCGAIRVDQQIGLEKTPEEYVQKLVAVFREVRRVLRDDGVVWLNLGDTYAGYWGDKNAKAENRPSQADVNGWTNGFKMNNRPQFDSLRESGLKPKDLVGVPWRVALALQADGWYLRSDVIWHKSNPMPSSATDRPTGSHEYIFLLTKQGRYFYDAEAVREPLAAESWGRMERKKNLIDRDGVGTLGKQISNGVESSHAYARLALARNGKTGYNTAGRNLRSVWEVSTTPYRNAHFATWPPALVETMIKAGSSAHGVCPECGAPWRRVVEKTGASMPVSERHGRTGHNGQPPQISGNYWTGPTTAPTDRFLPTCTCAAGGLAPDDLDIINTPTGSRAGDDPTMLTGRNGYNRPRGETEGKRPITRYEQRQYAAQLKSSPHRAAMESEAGDAFAHYLRTDKSGARPIPDDLLTRWIATGWLTPVKPPVINPPAPVPATVLDIFNGAGTTGLVANRLGRRYIGIDLNAEYCRLAVERIQADDRAAAVTTRPLQKSAGVAQLNLFSNGDNA